MGTAAKGTTLADSIWKGRSGIDGSADDFGFGSQFREEAAYLCPDLGTTGEALPIGPNQAYELVALVDGRDVVLGIPGSMGMTDAIDEQGFDIRLELSECRVALFNFCPGI